MENIEYKEEVTPSTYAHELGTASDLDDSPARISVSVPARISVSVPVNVPTPAMDSDSVQTSVLALGTIPILALVPDSRQTLVQDSSQTRELACPALEPDSVQTSASVPDSVQTSTSVPVQTSTSVPGSVQTSTSVPGSVQTPAPSDFVQTPSMRFITASKADQECVKDGNFERCRQSGGEGDYEGLDAESVRAGGGEYEEVGREMVVRGTSLTDEDFYSVSVHGIEFFQCHFQTWNFTRIILEERSENCKHALIRTYTILS